MSCLWKLQYMNLHGKATWFKFSHTAERVLHMQASLTFNQFENTTLQLKQLSLM